MPVRIKAAAAVFLCLLASLSASDQMAARADNLPPGFGSGCDGDNPWLVVACHPDARAAPAPELPSVVAFRDTPADSPQYELALYGEVGTIWGLAYSAQHSAVYAASFHKRMTSFGPEGPGAIYEIDLGSGAITTFATVPSAGPDEHGPKRMSYDHAGRDWAGKTSLGDIDLNSQESELYVTNLRDRRIYRFGVPSGQLLGSFAHGASKEPWAEDARPFGLKSHEGRLYHGVVNSAQSTRRPSDLAGFVYSSKPDGSEMRTTASFSLDYSRGTIEVCTDYGDPCGHDTANVHWNPWIDGRNRSVVPDAMTAVYPMPVLSDIEVDGSGSLIIGLHDRQTDVTVPPFLGVPPRPDQGDLVGVGVGDVLRGTRKGDSWDVTTRPEHYDDSHPTGDESVLGGLANLVLPDQVVATRWFYKRAKVGNPPLTRGAIWLDNASGAHVRQEEVCRLGQGLLDPWSSTRPLETSHDEGDAVNSLGDTEVFCPVEDTPTTTPTSHPTRSPTPTETATASPAASATAQASVTPTPRPTCTATVPPAPHPAYLPLVLKEHCDPTLVRADVVLVIDTSSSMTGRKLADAKDAAIGFLRLMDLAPGRDQVAVVRFDTDAELVAELNAEQAAVERSIRSLETRRGTHIDRGLQEALAELQSRRRLNDNTPVAILLTDGKHTGTPGTEVATAVEMQEAYIRLYTIGLGSDVDEPTLIEMAGDRSRYYFAPDSKHLEHIYAQVAHDIDCPAEDFWGQR